MDKEKEFLVKLLATFKLEADEHLKTLSDGLIALETPLDETKKKEWIETIYRESHSLKGAARSVNHDAIQVICQDMENVLSAWKSSKIEQSRELFDTLYATIDFIEKVTLSPPKSLSEEDKVIQLALIQRLDSLLISPKKNRANEERPPSELPKIETITKTSISSKETPDSPISSEKTIRISVSKLDKLFQQVEELLSLKMTVRQEVTELKGIQTELRHWDKHLKNLDQDVKKSPLDITKGYRQYIQFVKSRINKLTKTASQDNRFIGNMVDTLLEDTKKVLTQPFATLFDVFPRMVRDTAKSLGKEIHLIISGGEIEIDRRILEEMKDPLIHLIRNSIDHGIESPEERVKMGKTPSGTITIAVSQISGSNIQLEISDDGRGIDLEAVKSFAVNQGYISKEDSNQLTNQEAIALIFHSGISTSSTITELSGRGLGMSIISEKVEKLNGKLITETKKNEGTVFKLILPVTLATFRGVHLKVCEREFIFPVQYLKHVMRVTITEIKTVENQMMIVVEGKLLPFVYLGDLLNLPKLKDERNSQIYVMIIKASEKIIAIGVDHIISEQEILVKSLGKQLVHVKNILAATIMEGGKIVPVLHPVDLVRSSVQGAQFNQNLSFKNGSLQKKNILLVEDSITSRMLLKNILEVGGYHVLVATDGIEALMILQNEMVDLIVSDVEMPRMNGIDLVIKIRENEKLKDLPVILCSALGSKEDKERGVEVGANAYLDKSNFKQSDLLEIIQKIL